MTMTFDIWYNMYNIAYGVLLHSWEKWEGKFILQPSFLRVTLMTSI